LEPLALSHPFFALGDVMTRRFAVGHNPDEDGTLRIARLWKGPRCRNPSGDLASSAAEVLRWARFHLGDGRAESGDRVLPTELLHQMKEPANAGPNGIPFNLGVIRWALQTYLGVIDRDPEPLPFDAARAREVVGTYEIDVMTLFITSDETQLKLEVGIKPAIRAASETEMPPDYAPAAIGLLPGDSDEYILTEGGMKGQRGFFTRGESGAIVGVDLAGRLFSRIPTASGES
jgi:hypothetical protein